MILTWNGCILNPLQRFHFSKEKENSEFKPVKLRLKIDLVSYPARAEGLVNRITKDFYN